MVSWFPLPPNYPEPHFALTLLSSAFTVLLLLISSWGEHLLADLVSPLREKEREGVEEDLSREGEIPLGHLHSCLCP